ncbi:MAG: glycoside hydrolase 100 family protein [candidate division WOR-3 bacterium]
MNYDKELIERAKEAAIDVLLNNAKGPYKGLPRTAGWGYPEPYTRDLMISSLGFLTSENKKLIEVLRKVLERLAKNQTEHGHIPSFVHTPKDRGSSDTTPLFLMAVGFFRNFSGEKNFLAEAVEKAMKWMEYQSPEDNVMVAQLPTSDWRDELWVLGHSLFLNTIVYTYLKLLGNYERAKKLKRLIETLTIDPKRRGSFLLTNKPYYAFWIYKIYKSTRFDLLGNSLAILSGLCDRKKGEEIINWVEKEIKVMQKKGLLWGNLPPCLFPFIHPEDPDWMPRYAIYNNPGEYQNGGIWPFICGFYIAALVAIGKYELAEDKLMELTNLVKFSRNKRLDFGFNEWIKAQNGEPMGEDWQSWSAALYIYAAKCVEIRKTPFFEEVRK